MFREEFFDLLIFFSKTGDSPKEDQINISDLIHEPGFLLASCGGVVEGAAQIVEMNCLLLGHGSLLSKSMGLYVPPKFSNDFLKTLVGTRSSWIGLL